MYDLSVPNSKPGPCAKCAGTGSYKWSATEAGRAIVKAGPCYSCRGTGEQRRDDIRRNSTYNRFKIARLASL